jgi:hypothetical protein
VFGIDSMSNLLNRVGHPRERWRTVLLGSVLVLATVPVAVRAAKVTVPGRPTITNISSAKHSSTIYSIKVRFAHPTSNGGSAVISTTVTAGGKSCTAVRTSQTCTITNLRK